MSEPERRIVMPNPDGGWDVAARNAERASAHFDTQAAAIDRGREIPRKLGGGELEIRGENGAVRKQDTVPAGNDQRSSTAEARRLSATGARVSARRRLATHG